MYFLKKIVRFLLPHSCILCRNTADQPQDICKSCFASLPFYPQGCQHCARIIAHSEENLICGECLQAPPAFNTTFVLFSYAPPITKLILDLKFQSALSNALLLGTWMSEKICDNWYANSSLPDVIIPMPLNAKRIRERGFNQAVEIARPIQKKLKIPLLLNRCERIKPTLAQATLKAEQRQKNMKNAFKVQENFKGEHVAVVDDVITTGATMTEFCKTLKKHGAGKIDVWCCARPVIDNQFS